MKDWSRVERAVLPAVLAVAALDLARWTAALRWWWEELALLEAFQSGRDDRTPAAKHIHDADLAQLDAHEAILDALAQFELRRP